MSVAKPFSCELCAQSFTRSENLDRHKRARHDHSGRNIFTCEHCHAGFSRRDVCKRHVAKCSIKIDGRKRRKGVTSRSGLPRVEQPEAEADPEPDPSTDDLLFHFSPPSVRASDHSPDIQMISPSQGNTGASARVNWNLSNEIITQCAGAYFAKFHRSLPLVHRPTFTISSTPKTLLMIVVAIGGTFLTKMSGSTVIGLGNTATWSHELWEMGMDELEEMLEGSAPRLRQKWVLQSCVLHLAYGFYFGSPACFRRTRNFLAQVIDVARQVCLFNQQLTFPMSAFQTLSSSEIQALESQHPSASPSPSQLWSAYAEEEAVKLAVFALVFLDSQIVLECNLRSMISSAEFAWELPHATALWEARTADSWAATLKEQFPFVPNPNLVEDSSPGFPSSATNRGHAVRTIMTATQQLMSSSPPAQLLRALARCPFGLLCVATNLHMLVRTFTECFYQLPPNLADPSAFHILTQSQNRQVNAAIKHIYSLAPNGQLLDQPLERAIRLACWTTRIGLCKPDDLLITGVTDTPVAAGLAIAAHLSLGSYGAARRAAISPSSARRFGDDGVLCIIDDMLKAWSDFVAATGEICLREPPWVTTANFRVSLTLWRTLRACVAEVTKQLDLAEDMTGRFDPAKVALVAIADEIRRCRSLDAGEPQPQYRPSVPDDLSELEGEFASLLIQACRRRVVSGIGQALATVVEEIRRLDPSAFDVDGFFF